ncbi:hypothetical protein MNAN1_002706 [Malassezia nana]|uniref:Protein transport protein sec16 n=1 Tax=Malassezia nana TaxID=180528 RepID=A0AAF0EJV2_9BASI|nr:hypothetical protein MNAN1_002706 [Malassezia nana]
MVSQPQVPPPAEPEDGQQEQEQDPWSMEWGNDEWQVDQVNQQDMIPFDTQVPDMDQPSDQYAAQESVSLEEDNQVSTEPIGFDAAPGAEADPWGLDTGAQDYDEPFLDPSQYDAELENLMSTVTPNVQTTNSQVGPYEGMSYSQEGTFDGAPVQDYGHYAPSYTQAYPSQEPSDNAAVCNPSVFEGGHDQFLQEGEFLPDGAYDNQGFFSEQNYAQEGYAAEDYAQTEFDQGEYAQNEYTQAQYSGYEYAPDQYAVDDYAQDPYAQGEFTESMYGQGAYHEGNAAPVDYSQDVAHAEYIQQPVYTEEHAPITYPEDTQQDLYGLGTGTEFQPSGNDYAQDEVYATDAYAESEQLPEPTPMPQFPPPPVQAVSVPEPTLPSGPTKPAQSRPMPTNRRMAAAPQTRPEPPASHSSSRPAPLAPPVARTASPNVPQPRAGPPPKATVPKADPTKVAPQPAHEPRGPAAPRAQRKGPARVPSPAKPQERLLSPPVVAERVQPPPAMTEPLPAASADGGDNWAWTAGAEPSASEAVDDAWGWDGNDQDWQQPVYTQERAAVQNAHSSPKRTRQVPASTKPGKVGVKSAAKPKFDKPICADPVQERLGKTVPIASFGIGGKLVVHLPHSKAEGDAYEYDTPRIMRRVHIRPLAGYMGARPFSTLDMLKFPGPLMEGSKSNAKGKKTAILKYLHEQIAESASGVGYLRRKSALFSSHSFDSNQDHVDEWRRMEDKILLLKILALLVENDGQWSGSDALATTVCHLLTGRSEETDMSAFTVPTYSRTSSQSAMKRSIRTYALRQGFLEELQPMLQQGDLQRAVEYAMEEKMWAHAMTISQQLDPSIRNRVIEEFMRYELDSPPPDNMLYKDYTSIKVAYALYSSQSHERITSMFRDASGLSPEAQHAQWRHAVATLIANRSVASGFDNIVRAIGESLMQKGLPEAAHVCYLLSHQHRKWLGSGSPFLLLGTTASTPVLALLNDMDALLMTEVLEFILCLSHPKGAEPFNGIPALAPFKLMRAMVCDELGDAARAKKYCEALAQLSQTKGGAQVLAPNLQLELHELLTRLNGPRADGNHSWSKRLQRPTLDGVWGALEGRLTKFIAGEEMGSETKPSVPSGKGVGAFTHYSAITPEVASSDAPVQFAAPEQEAGLYGEDEPREDVQDEGQGHGEYVGSTLGKNQVFDQPDDYAPEDVPQNEHGQEAYSQGEYAEGEYAEYAQDQLAEGEYPEGDAQGEYAEGEYAQGEYAEQYPEAEYPQDEYEGQYPDADAPGEYAEGQPSEGQYAEGKYPGGDYAQGEYPEGEYAQGEYPEGQYAQGEYPEGEYAQGEYPEGSEYAEGDYPEGEYAQGEYPEGEYAEGENPEGEYAEGEYPEGEYAQGEYPEGGEYTEGEYPEGEYAEGEYPEGEYAEGEYPEGEYAQGEYPEGGEYTEGEYPEGEYAEGEYPEGEYAEGEYPEGEYAQGEYPEGGEYVEGEYPEGEYAEGDYPEGEYAEGDYPEGEYAEGDYPEGEYAEGDYPEGGEYAEGEYPEGEHAEGEYAEGEYPEGEHVAEHETSGEDGAEYPEEGNGASVENTDSEKGGTDLLQSQEQETTTDQDTGNEPSESVPEGQADEAEATVPPSESKPPLFHKVDADAEPELGEDGLLSTMPAPSLGPVPVPASKQESSSAEVEEDDLGLGNASHKETEKNTEAKEQKAAKKAPEKPAEKPASNSWLGRLWGTRSSAPSQSDKESKASKAHLGEETSFYYDKDLKRWVNKKAGDDGKTAAPALPPPPKAAKPAGSSSEKSAPPAPSKKGDAEPARGSAPPGKPNDAGYGDPPMPKPAAGKPGDRPPTGGASKKRPLKSRYIVVD